MSAEQTIFGQADAVALTIAGALNAASAAGSFCLPLKARWLQEREIDVKVLPKIGEPVDVQIFPMHDQADRTALMNFYDDLYGVNILIQQVVGGQVKTQIPILSLLRSQVFEWLMSQPLTTTNAVHNVKGIHVNAVRPSKEGLYWIERLHQEGAFYSDNTVTFKAPGLRRQ